MAKTQAGELKVLAGGGIAGPLNGLASEFERANGRRVVIQYDATPGLIKRSQSEPFDLGVAPREVYADAGARARFAAGPMTDIAQVGFGVAVRIGAPKPDISTSDRMKAALLNAKSIAFLPASAAGAQVIKAFEKLDIGEEMKAKTRVQPSPAAIPEAVARGDAELGIFLINVLMAPGVELAGPFPKEIQHELVFAAAVAKDTPNVGEAKAFIAFLRMPQAAAMIRSKAMTPL